MRVFAEGTVMPEEHPSAASLEAFAHGNLPAAKSRRIVEHLLNECEVCRRKSSDLWDRIKLGMRGAGTAPEGREARLSSPYRLALQHAVEEAAIERSRLENEREAAVALSDELLAHPQQRRLTLIKNSRRFQTWGLSEYLIDQSFACRFDHPSRGVDLAELSVAVAEKLDDERYGRRAVNDQIGRAWAYLGNALRVQSDLRGAGKAFSESRRFFAEGTRDELDRALWLRFHSHLLTTRSEFEMARSQQDQAIAIYRRCGQLANAAMLQSDQAVGILYSGDAEAALPRFEQALELSMVQGDERRVAMAHHNLASCLLELERYDEAREQLRRSAPVLRRLGDSLSLVRGLWLEAKIEIGCANLEAAERLLVQVRDTFIDEEIGYDAALSSLELATIYAAHGRTQELRELVGIMLPIFQSQDLHREALAALIVFRQAVEEETLTVARLHAILDFLHKARHKPDLRFKE